MGTVATQERPCAEAAVGTVHAPGDDDASFAEKTPGSEEAETEQGLETEGDGCGPELGVCHNAELGRRGEEAAARYLERKGFEILERNWTCAYGEVDIIAQSEETLVFVEVKTRSNTDRGLPEEAVDAKKRKRYEMIAATFLGTYDAVDVAVRFDVVAILAVGGERALLRHHISAFSADE